MLEHVDEAVVPLVAVSIECAEHTGDLRGHEGGIVNVTQRYERDAVVETVGQLPGHLQGETGLATPAWAPVIVTRRSSPRPSRAIRRSVSTFRLISAVAGIGTFDAVTSRPSDA